MRQPGGPITVQALRPALEPARMARLASRLRDARLGPELGDDWTRGVPGAWLRGLLDDWRAFDPQLLQRRLDGLRHQSIRIAGSPAVHVVVAEGNGPRPLPLLLTHGWPGSFLEYADIVAPLTDPAGHGGDARDAFTVVVPSLPGYGFSEWPAWPETSSREIAGIWHAVMSALGHDRYVAHGSDLGAGVTAWLARDRPGAVAAIHLATPGLATAPAPVSDAEAGFASEVAAWSADEGGYLHEHATKPATIAAALFDNPAGLAAWIGEKVVAWSSARADGAPAFDRRLLLETLTLYWATDTAASSLMPYWTAHHRPDARLPADDPPTVPTSISVFGGERVPFPKPPRSLAERYFRIDVWAEHGRGGHFPSVAEPDLLVRTLRDVFRKAR